MLAVIIVAVLVPAAAFVIAFPDRTDYVGNCLAGAGGTALVLAAVAALPGRRPGLVVAGTAAAIVAGVGTELTLLRLAFCDPVDLATSHSTRSSTGRASSRRPARRLVAGPGGNR